MESEVETAGEVEAEALRLLERLSRQPSVSAENRALAETADLVESLLAEAGFSTRQLVVDGSPPAVWAERRGRSAYTLLLYDHYDVQPVDPIELWESPPFEPTLRDGKLFARGAADDKGSFAVRLAVIAALLAEHGELPVGIRWIVEGEEEVGSPHFDGIAREHAELLRADACLWEGSLHGVDGRATIGLGFKGLLYVHLEVEALARDAHSAVAAVVPSAAWRLVDALSSIRGPDGRVRIAGFYDAVRAPSAAARDVMARNGPLLEREIRSAIGVERFLDGIAGAAVAERLSFAPTSNIAGIGSGYTGPGQKTVLPARARASLDFRLVPDQRPDDILAALRAHLSAAGFDDVVVTAVASAEPVATPLDHPFVARVTDVAERVAGAPPLVVPMSGGTLPLLASLRDHVGVAGLSAPDKPAYFGSAAHAPNEHVRLEDVTRAARFFRALLETLG